MDLTALGLSLTPLLIALLGWLFFPRRHKAKHFEIDCIALARMRRVKE